jgi:uncharacterized membrane protein
MTLYTWLKFFHLFGLTVFLFAHGVSGGASFALGTSASSTARQLLALSQRASFISNPGLLIVIITGVWMAFLGSWWGHGWVWAAIVILVALVVGMGLIARPYYMARDAARKSEEDLAQTLSRTRPQAAAWMGSVGLLLLVGLMVLKPF